MTRNPMLAALIFGPFLSAVLSAQDQPIPIAPGTPVTPLTRDTPGPAILPAVPVPVVPAPPTFAHPTIPNAVQPYFPHRDFTTTIPAPPGRVVQLPTRETYTGPAKVSFDDGTTLTGEIQAHGPLDCVASFGPIAVPFNKIRGISWHDSSESQGPPASQATLVLEHNDTLTVTVSCPGITVKTSWGQANIELPHVRSLLLTTDKVRWSETPDGRCLLAPDSDAPDSDAPPAPQ